MKVFFAILLLIPFGLTLYAWENRGFGLYGGDDGTAMAAGLFMVLGLPCGLIAAALLWWRSRS